jgi:hypothetical protein
MKNFIGAIDLQDFGDSEDEVANFGDECSQPFLTREDYEKSLNIPQPSNEDEEGDHTDLCVSQPETEMIAAEFQPKYNLRSKNKPTSTDQPKRILQRGQAHEPLLEETLLPSNKIKVEKTQESKVKKVETQTKETGPVDKVTSLTKITSNKEIQTSKAERKNSEVATKETDKENASFSFESELNKIKILIPLV